MPARTVEPRADAGGEGASRLAGAGWILLAILTLSCAYLFVVRAIGNTNFMAADALAPFRVLDHLYHGEGLDLSRESSALPVLPWLLARLLRLWPEPLGYRELFAAYGAGTALFAAATLPLAYLLARRFLGPLEALIPVLLLGLNASFGLYSILPNPTQAYAFLFTLAIVALDRERPRLAILAGAASVLVRWEGLLLILVVGAYRAAALRRWAPLWVAGAMILALIAVHLLASATPFAFLVNTNAKPVREALDPLQLFTGALEWKFDKLHAFAVNMTMIGLLLVPVGAMLAIRRRPALATAPLYWIGYEGVMLLFTLLVPIGNYWSPTFSEVSSAYPVTRYYQIFTPVLCLFAYLGLREVLQAVRWPIARPALIGSLVLGFGVHQAVLADNTYRHAYKSFARDGLYRDVVDAAEFFRARGVRRADIAMGRLEGGTLAYQDVLGSWRNLQLTSYHIAVLSGRNRVNCTGDNLINPGLYCSLLARTKVADLGAPLPTGGRADWLIVVKPLGGPPPPSFAPVHENGSLAIFQRAVDHASADIRPGRADAAPIASLRASL